MSLTFLQYRTQVTFKNDLTLNKLSPLLEALKAVLPTRSWNKGRRNIHDPHNTVQWACFKRGGLFQYVGLYSGPEARQQK